MNKQILFLAFLAFTYIQANAQSAVYKVSGKGTTMYLGGTIHILKESDFPLPKEYDEAYLKSSLIIFETNLKEMESPGMSTYMMEIATYKDDKTLKTELNKEQYKNLKLAYEKEGLSIAMFENFKPIMAVISLTMLKLQKLGYTSDGVDKYFENKAIDDDISTGGLEKAKYQLKLLTEVGEENPNEFVAYSLKDLDNMETYFDEMKDAWRNGKGDVLVKMNQDWLDSFPEIYDKLLVLRNNNWMKKINLLMETSETEFILVGAMHLYGKNGLIELLESEGYKIEQL